MGFGSYDESDQQGPEYEAKEDNDEDTDLHENDYEGTVSYDSGASTDDLLDGLASIKDEESEE